MLEDVGDRVRLRSRFTVVIPEGKSRKEKDFLVQTNVKRSSFSFLNEIWIKLMKTVWQLTWIEGWGNLKDLNLPFEQLCLWSLEGKSRASGFAVSLAVTRRPREEDAALLGYFSGVAACLAEPAGLLARLWGNMGECLLCVAVGSRWSNGGLHNKCRNSHSDTIYRHTEPRAQAEAESAFIRCCWRQTPVLTWNWAASPFCFLCPQTQ